MRKRGMAQVMVPLTRSIGSSGDTGETEEEDEVVARIAIVSEEKFSGEEATVLTQIMSSRWRFKIH